MVHMRPYLSCTPVVDARHVILLQSSMSSESNMVFIHLIRI